MKLDKEIYQKILKMELNHQWKIPQNWLAEDLISEFQSKVHDYLRIYAKIHMLNIQSKLRRKRKNHLKQKHWLVLILIQFIIMISSIHLINYRRLSWTIWLMEQYASKSMDMMKIKIKMRKKGKYQLRILFLSNRLPNNSNRYNNNHLNRLNR